MANPRSSKKKNVESSLGSRVARRNVGEIVGDHIRRLVFEGELREGERVPQREIAEALGVSSIPVREALVALQREGVVTIEPSRGAFVNRLDSEVATEQFYVFGRIYGLATRRATERASQQVVDELEELAKEIAAARDPEELLALSIRFQWLILEAGGSRRLQALFDPLSRIVPGNFYVTIPGSAEATRRGVAEMVEAISSRRAEAAEYACWRLIDAIGELVAVQLRERDSS
ncbi:MAG: GntR family transcriptional regulator [Deltaproteobacteria bacterium]|nr:GntR family transcriptional regulator [Deltaproteobacteria bacterium]